MKFAFTVFMVILPALACVVGAVLMALHDKPGWGWMLFVALCLGGSTSIKERHKKEGGAE